MSEQSCVKIDRAQLMFVGVDGISPQGGLTSHNPMEARINGVLLERASWVVVVADHTKVGRKTFAQIAPIEEVNTLITDAARNDMAMEDLRRRGLDIITV